MCENCEILKKSAEFDGRKRVYCKECGTRSRFSRKKKEWIIAPKAKRSPSRNPIKYRRGPRHSSSRTTVSMRTEVIF